MGAGVRCCLPGTYSHIRGCIRVSDHVHKYRYVIEQARDFDDTGTILTNEWTFKCKCGEELGDEHGPIEEIERRINAWENYDKFE